MQTLHAGFSNHFADVFKTITGGNSSEFEAFAHIEQWGTKAYFAYPYSLWERPENERRNGLLRGFISKDVSIERFTPPQILTFADEMNGRPRKGLGYQTPEELFEVFLDSIYAA